jgi:hypothetical protein
VAEHLVFPHLVSELSFRVGMIDRGERRIDVVVSLH